MNVRPPERFHGALLSDAQSGNSDRRRGPPCSGKTGDKGAYSQHRGGPCCTDGRAAAARTYVGRARMIPRLSRLWVSRTSAHLRFIAILRLEDLLGRHDLCGWSPPVGCIIASSSRQRLPQTLERRGGNMLNGARFTVIIGGMVGVCL